MDAVRRPAGLSAVSQIDIQAYTKVLYPMKRTSLFLDDKLLRALRRAAAKDGVSVASLVREAVARYLAEPRLTPPGRASPEVFASVF